MPPKMMTASDLGVQLDGDLQVQIPEVWLRADNRMQELAFRMDSSRVRRGIAACLEEEVIALEGMRDLSFLGRIRPHGEGELLTVDFVSVSTENDTEDSFRFSLRNVPNTLDYTVQSRAKFTRDMWGGGCVPDGLQKELIGAITTCMPVARAAERFGRTVLASDVDWDWVPHWEYGGVALPDGRGTLRTLAGPLGRVGGEREYLALATWNVPIEERPSAAGGIRVRMVLDPQSSKVVAEWDEEWCELF